MQDKIKEARLRDYRKWATPSVVNILKGVEKMCLDYKRAREIPLTVNDEGMSYTDGKRIVVSLMHSFLDPKYSETYWMVVMKASTAHECQHVNSSSIKRAKKMAGDFGTFMKTTYGFSERIGENLAFDFFNIIEDGRIENIIVDRMPGMKINFLIKNGEIRGQGRITEKAEDGDSQTEYRDFMNQVLSYAKCGGNLPGIEVYKGTRLESEFMSIRDDIDAGVRAYSCGDCCKITKRILHTIAPYLNDLLKEDSNFTNVIEQMLSQLDFDSEPEDEEYNEAGKQGNAPLQSFKKKPKNGGQSKGSNAEESDGDNDGEAAGEEGSDEQDGEKKGGGSGTKSGSDSEEESESSADGSSKDKKADNKRNASGDKKSKGGDSEENGESDSSQDRESGKKESGRKSKGDKSERKQDLESRIKAGSDLSGDFSNMELQTRGYTEEELQKAAQIVKRELEKAAKELSKAFSESGVDSSFVAEIAKATGTLYREVRVPCGQMPLPKELAAKALQLKQEMAKILKIKNQSRYNTRQGVVNPNALWKVRCKEDNLFKIENKKSKSSVAVYLLIDNSGSMEGAEKSYLARIAAVMVEEAFGELASCKIVLFAADGRVVHWIVKPFDKKSKYNACYNSLYSVVPCGGNRDGYSIRIAAEELKKRKEKKKVLIVLSDGLPSDYNSASAGMADVRAAVDAARKDRVEVFSIMYGDRAFQRDQRDNFMKMYGRNVISSDPETIIKNLTKLFKGLIV